MNDKRFSLYLSLALILICISAILLFNGYNDNVYLLVRSYHLNLKSWVTVHPILVGASYSLAYILITTLSLPIASLFTLLGGYLFPQPFSTLLVTLSATVGATFIFLLARYATSTFIHKIDSATFENLKKGFSKNPVEYMLFLRFLPIFPFWLVNIIPAFFHLPVRQYIGATAIGILPGVFVYTQVGRGLASILAEGNEPKILTPDVLIALCSFAFLALISAVVKQKFLKSND